MQAQIFDGSRFSSLSSIKLLESASRIRARNRSRIRDPWPYRPFELNPYPITGAPSRTISVTTATTEQVIFEKSIYAFEIGELIATVFSNIFRMRILFLRRGVWNSSVIDTPPARPGNENCGGEGRLFDPRDA